MGRERKKEREHAAPWRRKREEEDAEEEEELIFPLWEKHMLESQELEGIFPSCSDWH